ncbi:MAG: MBOAT family O-acyltransferase, partial [Bacteroidia bacterium]
ANWTFIVWGGLNAVYFLPLLLLNKNRTNMEVVAQGNSVPSAKELLNMMITFGLVVFAWIFFRADSVSAALLYISDMLSLSMFKLPQKVPVILLLIVFIFILIEWFGREQQYALADFGLKWTRAARWSFYFLIIIAISNYGGANKQFIYFQF